MNGFEGKIEPFGAEVCGAVKSEFQKDGILRAERDGLIGEDLERTVLKTNREIVGDDAFDTARKYLV